jgi:monosaccharide-transporting ATPase
VQTLFGVLRRLRAEGMAILFVTHFLEQTYAISDRITVMRNGEREGEYPCAALSRLALVNKMIGAAVDTAPADAAATDAAAVDTTSVDAGEEGSAATPRQASEAGAVFLRAQGIARKGVLQPVDLALHRGELLGLAGLLGSGRTETARLLFGADRADAGTVEVEGRRVRLANPRDAIAQGIGFCSEDRKHEGAILPLSVRENLILALQARQGIWRAMPLRRQQQLASDYVKWLGIKTASIETPIGSLSGGNQQKVLLARWLATEPGLLILDEPTRGIDVRAKQEIMDYVSALCRKGMSILFISSELPEVVRVSDRMLVMRDRRACGEYRRGELDDSSVLGAIAGEGKQETAREGA